MADTQIAITSGAGTNVDTRTEATNGHHRQVVVLGDPSVNAGVCPVDASAGLKVDLGIDNDVTVTSLIPGVAATSLGKAEDAAHLGGDTGVMALAVRNDAGTSLAGTTGDYIPLSTDSIGALRVTIVSGAGSGGTSLADEGTFAPAVTSFTPVGGIFNTAPDTLTTGKGGAFAMTGARGMHVHMVDPSGTSISAASTAITDSITAKLATDVIQDGLTALTPKFAVIQAGASGNNTIVAAVGGKKIRVLVYNFISSGSVNAKFQSGASGTDKTGLKYCIANMGISSAFCPLGVFETAAGALLNLNLSAAVAVGGELTYVEVT